MDCYDVLVAGGGPAGVCAALAAARAGAKTLLVTDRPVLGGNSSSEIRVWTRGATGGGNLFAEEMGVWGELKLENLARNPIGSVSAWDDVLLDAALREDDLTLLLNTLVTDVTVQEGRIVSIALRGLRTERWQNVSAQIFVDCTGDGFVAKAAGVPFRTGREDRLAFGESLAMSKADQKTQGCSILLQSKRVGRPVAYTPPDYAYTPARIEGLVGRGGRVVYADMQASDCWWFEYGGQLDVIADDQRITLELRAIALGIWNYIKNSGKFDAWDLQLEWMGYYPGRRGSRRLMGADTLTQPDVTEDLRRDHAVAYGGWYMDSHPSGGLMSEKEQCRQLAVGCYGIPFGCLYSQRVKNLLFAGRCASMSYVAYTSARIMNTCALTGQAAGTAAALCVRLGRTPEELEASNLPILRRQLALDDALLCYRALSCEADQVSASSQRPMTAEPRPGRLELSQESFVVFPNAPGQTATLYLEASEGGVELRCRACQSPLPSRRKPLEDDAALWSLTLQEGLNSIPLKADGNGFTLLWLESCPGASLPEGSPLPCVLAGHCAEAELFHPRISLSQNGHTAPAQVQDGYLRPWDGVHAWVSQGIGPGGETLTLRWKESVTLDSALLFLDPELSMELTSSHGGSWDHHHHYATRESMPPCLVRDYQLIALTPQGEQTLTIQRDNVQRRRMHRFAPVCCTALTLRVTATYGGDAVVYALLPNPEYDR